MTKIIMREVFRPHLLATYVALGVSAQAQAINFNIGEIEGQFDTTLSVGASWALRSADPDFISNGNSMGKRGEASSRSGDDGRLNFKKGETFSKVFKGVHDLELKYDNSGVFVRGKYWYDFELKDESRLFYDIDDSGRDRMAKASGTQLLDAFVYHNYQIGEQPGNVRLGKQVVSWGESTFIQNGINSINPVDVAALRRPGSEVKEGLIPVNMFYMSQNLTENLSAEGFYQIGWDHTVVDNCGTFFGADPISAGCVDRLVFAGPDFAPGDPRANAGTIRDIVAGNANAYIPRGKDNYARNGGQYGIAMRWYVPELNDTELGAYLMNYHSRNPYISATRTTFAGNPTQLNAAQRIRGASYFIDYPEDIRLYGVSFATNLSGVALGGEVSYRPNMPLQINLSDLGLSVINQGVTLASGSVVYVSPVDTTGFSTIAPGADLPGYKRMPVLQAQMTATKFIDQIWGASRLTLVGEVGYNRINGLGDADGSDLRFGRSLIYGSGQLPTQAVCVGTNAGLPNASNPQQECNDKGFYTTNSWGYRGRAILNYNNVIAGINLSPSLAWSHDVSGTGPNFDEGTKAISLGLDAEYDSTYTASLSYTDFFGGDYNTNTDRDFVALSFGVNF
ncbi:DUF1302 domain-containing protein [Pseudomonas farris]